MVIVMVIQIRCTVFNLKAKWANTYLSLYYTPSMYLGITDKINFFIYFA